MNRNARIVTALLAALTSAPAYADDGFWEQPPESTAEQSPDAPADAAAFAGEWRATVEPTGSAGQDRATEFSDGLLFRGGHLTAAAVAMYGFAPAAYTTQTVGGVETFEATMTSDQHGTMVWTGRRGGNGLIGELAWTKEDGRTFRYTLAADRPDVLASADE